MKPFARQDSRVLLTTPIFKVREDVCTHPTTGHTGSYYVLENPDWVNIIALTPEGKLLLVRQWRHGTAAHELEIPAGMVEPGESPEATAARELAEETGYVAERVYKIGAVKPNCAYQSNTCTTVVAEGCRATGGTHWDPGEELETLLVDPSDIPDMIDRGELRSGMMIAAFYFWSRLNPPAPRP